VSTPRLTIGKGRTPLRPFCFLLLFFCVGAGFSRLEPAKAGSHTVTLLHFSDYHSHAVPFYDDGRAGVGGIARAIGYLRQEKRKGALVFSGGDMVNRGSPAWSDKYQCAEWPWLNGIVDAMAFGNHDADYGRDAFERCRAQLRYPILSANTAGMQKSVVLQAKGVRIGVFALSGPDFPSLVKAEGFAFGARIAAATEAVRELRTRADVVVMIGHEHVDDDYALARAVPGIDLIFGTHSHLRRELTRIDGTNTWFISPGQYLTHVSRVELTLECGGDSRRFEGRLVPIDQTLPLDRAIAARVSKMQKELEHDPQYAALFAPIATLREAISVEALGRRAVDVMRSAAKADVAISTASSFRQALAPGVLTLEALRAAMPYDNEIVVAELSGAQIEQLLANPGADGPFVVAQPETIDAGRMFRVAMTDYLARIANVAAVKTGLRVREAVRISFAP
jgi:5'-nucleotidase / UDP-sugar diphosphatase